MKFDIKKLPKSQIEILVEITPEEVENFNEKALKILGEGLEAPGFRKGHIPREIIEREVGQAKILDKKAELAIKENYYKVVHQLEEKNKIEVIGQPKIEILKLAFKNPLLFKVNASILPDMKLGDYKKIASQVKREEVFVEEIEIERALSFLQRSRAKFSQIARPAQKGDWVEISYSALMIEQGRQFEDKFILGQSQLLKGFEENIEGMSQGQEKEFSLDFPPDYSNKNLAGLNVLFKVKLNSLQKIELPELNDQFAKALGSFNDLKILKQNLKHGLKQEKEEEKKQKTREEILEKIMECSFFEIPEVLIEFEKKRMFENLKKYVSEKFQIDFKEYLKRINREEKEIEKSFFQQAQQRIKNFLILKEIARKENIKPSEEEIEERTIKAIKENYQGKERVDIEQIKEYIKEAIVNEKVFQLLENNIKT